MVYSTICGHINVLNHHQIPSVSIWSTHTENKSQDVTSIRWNFLWTCPVYFALQIDRGKTRSEEHNLMWFNLYSHHHSEPCPVSVCASGSYLLKQKWAQEPRWAHSLASILALPHSPGRAQEEQSSLKEHKWRPYLHLFTILNQRTDQWLPLCLLTYESLGIPTSTWAWIFVESAEVKAWFAREGKIFLSCPVHLHHSQHSWISQQCLSSICSTVSLYLWEKKNTIFSCSADRINSLKVQTKNSGKLIPFCTAEAPPWHRFSWFQLV